jgi:PAS domain S-box-containing protein
MSPEANSGGLCVLVHAPVGRDAQMILEVLGTAGISGEICRTLDGIADRLSEGAGALLITDDALNRAAIGRIAAWLKVQPPWSDLPVLVLTTGGDPDQTSVYRLRLIEPLGNVTLIERPVRKVTLISSVTNALRSRQRQYDIRDYFQELARSESRLRDAIEGAPIPIMVHAEDGDVLYLSRAWTDCSGYARDDIPTTQLWAEKAFGKAWAEIEEQLASSPRGTTPMKPGREVEIVTKAGKIRVWSFSINELPQLADGRKLFVRAAVDITEHNAITQALRLANADLEQFAYAAAHDLQEPIRNVGLYTQLLARHCAGKLDGTAAKFLNLTLDNSVRMQTLIQDLLAYTSALANNGSVGEQRADANEVMEDVLKNLSAAVDATAAEVVCDPLPTVPIPAAQLAQVLQNLVSNALKYRSDRRPRVQISAERKDKDWVFTVRDNGIGIPPQYHDRIFKVFRRLHGREIPGTGIGLAICERVVTHHGGRIWVESEPGRGSAFRFTVPVRKPA